MKDQIKKNKSQMFYITYRNSINVLMYHFH